MVKSKFLSVGKPISIEKYARTIAKKLDKEDLLKFEDQIEGQPKIIVGDDSRLREEVGYNVKYGLEEAMEQILNEE